MTIASAAAPLPLTVIGGFLGAGKTALVNATLEQANGRRMAILVNDFGALSIDAALISSRGATTLSLANGCVCCTLVNGLVQALIDVLQLDPAPEHVLIEASGVSDPRRISQIARAERAFAQDATFVVAAADQIRSLAADRYVADTVMRQLDGADVIVLNKVDLVGDDDADVTTAWLRAVAPRARVVRATHGALPCDVVLGTKPTLDDPAPTYRRARDRGEPQADHGSAFATRTLHGTSPISEAALRGALDTLPDVVLRAKGFVRLDTAPQIAHLVQVVGRRWTIAPARADAAADCTIVIIGTGSLRDADLAAIAQLFVS